MKRIERLLLRLLPLVLFVTCVVVIALGVLVQRNNENVEDLSESTERIDITVTHLGDFVDELEQETPEEQAQNAAVTEAVRQVPEIRAILCEQFPAASACQATP